MLETYRQEVLATVRPCSEGYPTSTIHGAARLTAFPALASSFLARLPYGLGLDQVNVGPKHEFLADKCWSTGQAKVTSNLVMNPPSGGR